MNSVIFDPQSLKSAIRGLALSIASRTLQSNQVLLVGIQTGGVVLAKRLAEQLQLLWNHPVPVGFLDVSMHRDDLDRRASPLLHVTSIPGDLKGRTVVLIDDVLYRGRTVRAAMDALTDLGRPDRIQLAVLVDRGNRELPIQADFVAKIIETSPTQRVDVRWDDHAGDSALLTTEFPAGQPPSPNP